jgi:hypothetical protein
MVEKPAQDFYNFIFRKAYFARQFLCIQFLFSQYLLDLFKNKVKFIFAQVKLVSFPADITDTSSVRFLAEIIEKDDRPAPCIIISIIYHFIHTDNMFLHCKNRSF